MRKLTAKLKKAILPLSWEVEVVGHFIEFSNYTDEDIKVSINYAESITDILAVIEDQIDSFDVSSEAYLWLDSYGHGKNGAPYDMKAVYESQEEKLSLIKELYLTLKNEFDE